MPYLKSTPFRNNLVLDFRQFSVANLGVLWQCLTFEAAERACAKATQGTPDDGSGLFQRTQGTRISKKLWLLSWVDFDEIGNVATVFEVADKELQVQCMLPNFHVRLLDFHTCVR